MTEQNKYPPHPAAACFPMMRGKAYEEFRDDIKAKGLLRPVVLAQHDSTWTILDGRNRARACDELGVKMRIEYYDGDDPVGYVISANLARRDLTEWERYEAAVALSKLDMTIDQAAEALRLSKRSVDRAKHVIEHAEPDVIEALRDGEVSLGAAEKIVREDDQVTALEEKKSSERKPKPFDPHVTKACHISDEDIAGVIALVRSGEGSPSHAVRHGADVIKRLVPAVRE